MIVWLYPSHHNSNPILLQANHSLIKIGRSVTILDRSRSQIPSENCECIHIPIGWLLPRLLTLPFLIEMLLRCLIIRTDLIIASGPDVGWIGKILSVLKGVPIVYYPFELYGEEYSRPQNAATSFWMWAERILLRSGVDLLITQNDERASVYINDRGTTSTPLVIRNYKPMTTPVATGLLRRKAGIADCQRIVLYQGALRPGRCLEQLVEAAAMIAEDAVLVLLGYDSTYMRRFLLPIIEQQNLSKRVFLVPGVAADALPALVADADVGVVVYEAVGRNNLYCAPGKLSDYVSASVPVVLPPFPSMQSLLNAYQLGVCYEKCSPQSIAIAINEVLAIPKEEWRDKMKPAQGSMIWETQEPLFLSAITQLIALRDKRL